MCVLSIIFIQLYATLVDHDSCMLSVIGGWNADNGTEAKARTKNEKSWNSQVSEDIRGSKGTCRLIENPAFLLSSHPYSDVRITPAPAKESIPGCRALWQC